MGRFVVVEIQLWLFITLIVVGIVIAAGGIVLVWWILRRRGARARTRIQEQAHSVALANRNRMLIRLDHELKNPLTALRTSAATVREMLKDEHVDKEAILEPIKQLDVSSRRVARLLADLRKLADVESRQIDFQRVNTTQLIHQAAEDARTAPGAEARTIVVNVAPRGLPDVAGEEDLLLSAILNLLGNALKYSTESDVVELRAGQHTVGPHRWVMIEVVDTGQGIPAADQAAVFDELSRGAKVRSIAGSGMGLTLVRAIVYRHGGTVELYSQEGVGTTVRILIPVLLPQQSARQAGTLLGTPRRTSSRRLRMINGTLTDTTTGEAFGSEGAGR